MSPLIVFDYIYYRIAFLYEHRFDYGQSKELSGITILTLFEVFNLFIIHSYFELITKVIGRRYIIMLAVIFVVLFVLNYIRYFKIINYSTLGNRWDNEGVVGRHIKGLFILSYFVLSFVFIC